MQKPALVQNETNAKASNNNFTQRSSSARLLPSERKKSQKGESPAIHGRQIIILSPAEIAEIAEMAAHSPIFAEQIKISAISAISAGHKKDLRAQHFCDFCDFCVTLNPSARTP